MPLNKQTGFFCRSQTKYEQQEHYFPACVGLTVEEVNMRISNLITQCIWTIYAYIIQ